MTVWQIALFAISLGGVALTYWSSVRLNSARHLKDSVLLGGKFSRAEEQQIRKDVHSGELPGDARLHAAALRWAREEASFGRSTWVWMFLQCAGAALVLSPLYLVPAVVIQVVAAVAQIGVLLAGVAGIGYSQSGISPARQLLDSHPESTAELFEHDK